jgi:hypothetical protein
MKCSNGMTSKHQFINNILGGTRICEGCGGARINSHMDACSVKPVAARQPVERGLTLRSTHALNPKRF